MAPLLNGISIHRHLTIEFNGFRFFVIEERPNQEHVYFDYIVISIALNDISYSLSLNDLNVLFNKFGTYEITILFAIDIICKAYFKIMLTKL